MTILSIDQVANVAWNAGFRGEALATIIAIAKPESGAGLQAPAWADSAAIGDVRLENATWGPSVGVWQIRSLKAEKGKRTTRDETQLTDPEFNARSAYEISAGGTKFTPWSTYKAGAHRPYMAAARDVAARFATLGGAAPGTAPATTASGTATDQLGSSPDVLAPPAPPLGANLQTIGSLGDVRILGKRTEDLGLRDAISAARVSLSTGDVSELAITLLDPGLYITEHAPFMFGADASWMDLPFEVAAVTVSQPSHVEQVELTLRSAGVEAMRAAVGAARGPVPRENVSASEWVQQEAARFGLGFVGKGTARRPMQVAANEPQGGKAESSWDVAQRLAKEEGFWCFEVSGVVYFGPPTWLIDHGVEVVVTWNRDDLSSPFNAARCPECRRTRDHPEAPGFPRATLTMQLPRPRGERVRPGMRVAFSGVFGFLGDYLVTDVEWNAAEPNTDVTVTAEEPKDPVPTLADDPLTLADSDAQPAADSAPTTGVSTRGARISQDERTRLFGPHGDRGRITQVTTPWGIRVSCHVAVKEAFLAACADADRSSHWKPKRIDSFNDRPIRGSTTWSNHAWALAWDFFDTANPADVWGAANAPDNVFREAFRRGGFYCGADYRDRKDYPHIEWSSAPPTPTIATATAARVRVA